MPTPTAVTIKGDRLVVMTIGEFFVNPQWPAAVKARVAASIRGRDRRRGRCDASVKVIVCDTKADPSEAQRCAQRAVDQHVVAVVGMSALDSDVIWPVLEAAGGIPVIGPPVNTERDATSPVAFPLASGIVGMFSASMP